MEYDAITIDTNIFIHNGLNLETGLLGLFTQFKEGSVEFVLSEIVQKEVRKHLTQKAEAASGAFTKAIRDVSRNIILSSDDIDKIQKIQADADACENIAVKRLDAFINATGGVLIPAEKADIKELVERYFVVAPPFEETDKKKNEFPDAISLLSLETWAKESDKKILAISADRGWVEFAKNSEWIDVQVDLEVALAQLQSHVDETAEFVSTLLADLDENKRPDLLKEITDEVSSLIAGLGLYGEANSGSYYVEVDSVELSLTNLEFVMDDGQYDFQIVRVGRNRIVASVRVLISAMAQGSFSFSAWDSVDKEYISMGDGSAEREETFEASILLDMEGDFSEKPIEFDISKIELVDMIDSVDFEEVEPDWESDNDYDPDDD